MPYQEQMGELPVPLGDEGRERTLHGEGVVGIGVGEAVRDPDDVRVHGKGRDVKSHGEDDIRGFSSYAGEAFQVFAGAGELPAVVVNNRFGEVHDIFRLVSVEAGTPDDGPHINKAGPRKVLEVRIYAEKIPGHRVDLPVGGLRGKDHGDRELVQIAVSKTRLHVSVISPQRPEDFV